VGDFRHLAVAWLAGLVAGFVVCLPIGPVNLTVINTALRKGFLSAFLVGCGAVCADLVYVALALAGHATLPRDPRVLTVLRAVAVVVVGGLGIRNLLLKTEKFEAKSEAAAERVDERWHHPRSFLLGFLLPITNLGLLVLWATIVTALDARELVDMERRASRWFCAAGVGVGALAWFFLAAWVVSRAHKRITPEALAWLARGCGVVFLIFAALLVVNLISPRI
jgi:threonine/homoserine/homoserine lactone efflux protein